MPGTPIDKWPLPTIRSATADEVAKQAILDASKYEEQLVKLILFHDDRALRVLSVYVPVMVALITTGIALHQSGKMTLYLGCMMAGVGASLFIGCLCAFATVWTAPIYLPNRKPTFWRWAIDHDVELRSVAAAYVEQSILIVAHNQEHSERATNNLMKAYACGLAAPIVGAACVWVAYWS